MTRLTSSQGTREREVVEHGVGQFFVADAAEAQEVLLGLLLDDVDDVVDGQHADQPLVLVDDGGRQKVVLLEDAAPPLPGPWWPGWRGASRA